MPSDAGLSTRVLGGDEIEKPAPCLGGSNFLAKMMQARLSVQVLNGGLSGTKDYFTPAEVSKSKRGAT